MSNLAAELTQLGVRPGEVIMVHASMRRVGDRAEELVAALDAVVGRHGTVVMTLGADPEAGPFDAETTPADPDIGVLAEVFRTTAGTIVSDHPEGRFGARGARAAELTLNVPWDDYYGPGSTLERVVDLGGRVLRLGAHPDTVTLYHWAEYLAELPDKIRVVRTPMVRRSDGTIEQVRVCCLDDSDGIAAWDGHDYFGIITEAYVASGRATIGRVGGARAELLDAADVVAFAVAWMERHLST